MRDNYDSKDAMLTNSLFYDFLRGNGLKAYKEESTRDIICVEFDYGSRSYEDEVKHLTKLIKTLENQLTNHSVDDIAAVERKLTYAKELQRRTDINKDKFDKKSANELRTLFYNEGIDIRYPIFKNREIAGYSWEHYKMLYRTPGKAKKGSCMFIRERLYDKAHEFLWMGLKLPEENAPIVEIGAYSSLITSTIVGKVTIKPEEILILRDVESEFITNVISVETDEYKHCIAKKIDGYTLKNVLFDGQALIDESIFPDWGEGYILLRHHFTKMAAFHTKIQKFFREHYGDDYETATIKDMFGQKVRVKDIKLITTDNATKFLKFNVSFKYWARWVRKNGCQFGIVKTAHESKLGNVQRMSYQMVNSLDRKTMNEVLQPTKDYIWALKTDDDVFMEYLARNINFSNDYEVLIALVKQDPDFIRSEYFMDRRDTIIRNYVQNFKFGRAIQNADNLVIVGNPYGMLMCAVGLNPEKDPTFDVEEGTIQCWTERFKDGEYLAGFRSPFNSQNNLGFYHNHYHEYFDRYFKLGKQIIAINMVHTDTQSRNNGLIFGSAGWKLPVINIQ